MMSNLWLKLLVISIIGFITAAILFAIFNTETENIWWVWLVLGFSTIFFIWSFVLYLIQKSKCPQGDVVVNHKKCPQKCIDVYDQPGDVVVNHKKCEDQHIIREVPGQTIVEERKHPDQHEFFNNVISDFSKQTPIVKLGEKVLFGSTRYI
jgi:hypothetical protein